MFPGLDLYLTFSAQHIITADWDLFDLSDIPMICEPIPWCKKRFHANSKYFVPKQERGLRVRGAESLRMEQGHFWPNV